MSQPEPLGPFKLVTVNTAPERAKRLVGRVVEAVKGSYTIIHAANVEGVSPFCRVLVTLLIEVEPSKTSRRQLNRSSLISWYVSPYGIVVNLIFTTSTADFALHHY